MAESRANAAMAERLRAVARAAADDPDLAAATARQDAPAATARQDAPAALAALSRHLHR